MVRGICCQKPVCKDDIQSCHPRSIFKVSLADSIPYRLRDPVVQGSEIPNAIFGFNTVGNDLLQLVNDFLDGTGRGILHGRLLC